MPFLGGSLAFERFSVNEFESQLFGQDHVDLLAKHAAGRVETSATENVHTGYLGGAHLLDVEFDLEKNIINDALHCSVRIDTNQIPAAIRKAWLQMELAALAQENTTGKLNKAQRNEAKEAVEDRCRSEAATGKYRKMKAFPLLWDGRHGTLYFGGSAGPASECCTDLLTRTFDVELRRISAGSIAQAWATETGNEEAVADLQPYSFVPSLPYADVAWANEHSTLPDFLGNEFLLWLWWKLETETDTFTVDEDAEVTVMMNKTLTLECPRGESGKETISAECPVSLPEAMQAIRNGKLPRKSGMIIVRDGQQFDLVLQAESFSISSAKIHVDDPTNFHVEDRIEAIRFLSETVDLMFHHFCERRVATSWMSDAEAITGWLTSPAREVKSAA